METDALSKPSYLIALGSNQRHVRHGLPRAVLSAAMEILDTGDIRLTRRSDTIITRAIGPSDHTYCNAAAIIETQLAPPNLLRRLKAIEADFGRRRGQKWSQRILDLDIILWSEGSYFSSDPSLTIPHPLMRERRFVLHPASNIAANWRDPISGLSIAHLYARLSARQNSPQKRLKLLDRKAKRN